MKFAFTEGLGGIVGGSTSNKPGSGRDLCVGLVHTVPFAMVLERISAPKQIDYLSLDVEGAESLVMKSFPFDTHSFGVLSVERPKLELVNMLRHHHYGFVCVVNIPGHARQLDEFWVQPA